MISLKVEEAVIQLSDLRIGDSFTLIDTKRPAEIKMHRGVFVLTEPGGSGIVIEKQSKNMLVFSLDRALVYLYDRTTQVRRVIRQ